VNTQYWVGAPGAATLTQPLRFGNYLGGLSWAGQLDEVTLWNRALSETELRSFMNHSLIGSESGLVGYWQLNEGTGSTTADSTGHAHTGVLQNNPTWTPSDAPIFH